MLLDEAAERPVGLEEQVVPLLGLLRAGVRLVEQALQLPELLVPVVDLAREVRDALLQVVDLLAGARLPDGDLGHRQASFRNETLSCSKTRIEPAPMCAIASGPSALTRALMSFSFGMRNARRIA